MKRLTGKYENGTAYYNIVPGESTIDRLAAIEDSFWALRLTASANWPRLTGMVG